MTPLRTEKMVWNITAEGKENVCTNVVVIRLIRMEHRKEREDNDDGVKKRG